MCVPRDLAGQAARIGTSLERGDVDGLGAVVARLGIEAHPGALGEGPEARAVDAGAVDDQVLAGHDAWEGLIIEGRAFASGTAVYRLNDGTGSRSSRTTKTRLGGSGPSVVHHPPAMYR